MKNSVAIRIETSDAAIKDLLIARLADIGFNGFEEEKDHLVAYCVEEDVDESSLQELMTELHLSYTKQIITGQNWNALWENNFEPVVVGDFVAVRADFHEPIHNVQHEMIITPKMSFGTGHHATTFMMMQQMQLLDLTDKPVLDFGTGTGILAILAEKCGATSVTAIDNDEWSIANAHENIARNNCNNIKILKGDEVPAEQQFAFVLANINKHIILENFSQLSLALLADGYLLLSGLLEEDEKDILLRSGLLRLKHIHTVRMNGWMCILLKN
jgi:ribosomal protein L11 methyltransferase